MAHILIFSTVLFLIYEYLISQDRSQKKGENMRIIKIANKKKLDVCEVAHPKPDGENVVIKVSAVGICGTDLHYWEQESYAGTVMGHEYVGTVSDPGSRNDLQVGDRVTAIPINPCMQCATCMSGNVHLCMQTLTQSPGTSEALPGAYAEYAVSRPDMVRKIPDSISDIEATMIEPTSVALRAVREARVTVGDKVLVTGAGVIGLLAAMFARKAGASLVAMTEVNPIRAAGARRFGDAHMVFDAFDPGLIGSLLEVSDPGFDVCLECAGVGASIDTAIVGLNPGGGVMVQVALNLEPVPISLTWMVIKEVKIRPVLGYFIKDFDTCLDLISKKEINVERFVTKICGFDDAQNAFSELASGKSQDVKVVIRP